MHCVGVLILGWVVCDVRDTISFTRWIDRWIAWKDGIIGVHLDVGWN
jgi:hypothetical protein